MSKNYDITNGHVVKKIGIGDAPDACLHKLLYLQ